MRKTINFFSIVAVICLFCMIQSSLRNHSMKPEAMEPCDIPGAITIATGDMYGCVDMRDKWVPVPQKINKRSSQACAARDEGSPDCSALPPTTSEEIFKKCDESANRWESSSRLCADEQRNGLRLIIYAPFQSATYRRLPNGVLLPDSKVTPGEADPLLTAAKLCDPTFHTGTVRAVTQKMKKQVYAEYGVVCGKGNAQPCSEFEVDHLVSIEIGGAETIANLWPQPALPIPGFHEKDKIENAAKRFVCGAPLAQRQSRLLQTQRDIADNWYALGQRIAPQALEVGK